MRQKGTTLVETLVACAIFLVVSLAIYQLYIKIVEFSASIRATTVATQIAGEHVEFVRNLQYVDVGTVGGIPSGVVPEEKTVVRNGSTYTITTTIRNIDFPADGTLGGTPNDLSPADNKLITVEVTCTTCKTQKTVTHTSYIAPKSLETENGNGALVIKAIDANGLPVQGAIVSIQNSNLTPAVAMTDTTDSTGVLTIVDAPPSTEQYSIAVSKPGYSTDITYQPGVSQNPNPLKPHLTVAQNTVTQSTFAIDKTSAVTLSAQSAQCVPITGVSGMLVGTKLIGTSPSVIKNKPAFLLASGPSTIDGIEWDTYGITLSGTTYNIAGVFPLLPLSVTPDSSQSLTLTLKPSLPNRLVVGVVDAAGVPLYGATVSVSGITGSRITGTSVRTQTDWSGGDGQSLYTNEHMFFESTGIAYQSAGEIGLAETAGAYALNGTLVSSTIDFGAPVPAATLTWSPETQPEDAGVMSIRFQIAANNDNTTWDYVGPDGTNATFYTTSGETISTSQANTRYMRYKLFLSTEDDQVTPSLSEVSITTCLPPGQVDFGGLADGSRTITVTKDGYTPVTKTLTISNNWYETITLTP